MRDYPNMSYCMFENTASAMVQIVSTLADKNGNWKKLDINKYERPNVHRLASLCAEFLEAYDDYEEGSDEEIEESFDEFCRERA